MKEEINFDFGRNYNPGKELKDKYPPGDSDDSGSEAQWKSLRSNIEHVHLVGCDGRHSSNIPCVIKNVYRDF